MSRVLAVVDKSIKVSMYDVVPGDILSIVGNESDPVIEEIKRDGKRVRFYYKPSGDHIDNTVWMNPTDGSEVFIHDLKGERFEFLEKIEA